MKKFSRDNTSLLSAKNDCFISIHKELWLWQRHRNEFHRTITNEARWVNTLCEMKVLSTLELFYTWRKSSFIDRHFSSSTFHPLALSLSLSILIVSLCHVQWSFIESKVCCCLIFAASPTFFSRTWNTLWRWPFSKFLSRSLSYQQFLVTSWKKNF